MIHGWHRVYHMDRLASLAVSVVWMLRYTAVATPHRGSILDLESGRTTAVLCKCHKATPSNHIARCPKRPKPEYPHLISTMSYDTSDRMPQWMLDKTTVLKGGGGVGS